MKAASPLRFIVLVSSVALVPLAQGQQPPAPNPQAPTINAPFPMGMQRGTTLDLTLAGTNLAGPTGVLLSFPGKVTIPSENNNGKDNAKLLIRLEVPKETLLGWHTLRVATTRGMSNFRLFCIDDLPQVLEQDSNRSLATAQAVPLPCVVCGRADPEITDYFKFSVQAGQRLSFEVLGRRLGSNLDPQISLLDPKTGRQLAFSDDAPGQNKDPRLSFTFKEAGEYVIEIRDVRYQGGGDWFYRLRIGDFPCATTPVPLAVKRGTLAKVHFAGPYVEGVPPTPVLVPMEFEAQSIAVWPTSATSGLPGWPVELGITDRDELLEIEPNDDPAKPQRLPVTQCGVSGRFDKKPLRDVDYYAFAATKGQRWLIDAQTLEFHSPTYVDLILKNAKGEQVAASKPEVDPARIDFTAPEDGDYTLQVLNQLYKGGPEETYRITLTPHEPGFALTTAIDRVDVPQGGNALVTVQAARRDYNGPIDVQVVSPPGVTGSSTIPAGQTSTLLPLTALAGLPPSGHRLAVVGQATIGNRLVTERADMRAIAQRDLGNLPFPPQPLADRLALAVTHKAPFALEARFDQPEGIRGLSVPVTIRAIRSPGFDEEITVASVNLPVPQGQPVPVPPVNAKIPKGQSEVKLELKPPANAPLGAIPLGFRATAKEFANTTPLTPLVLTLPFELQVDTAGGKLLPAGTLGDKTFGPLHALDVILGRPQPVVLGMLDYGFAKPAPGKHKLKVKAIRKGGYKGPIALEVRNLPANVTAAKATIAENQNEAEIELAAPANAGPGDKTDVNVLGTAPAAGNQQNASANFTLSVVKK